MDAGDDPDISTSSTWSPLFTQDDGQSKGKTLAGNLTHLHDSDDLCKMMDKIKARYLAGI